MRCTIWYYLYNLKNVKNIHGGVLPLVKLQAKVILLHKCFSSFLNCTNCNKPCNAPQINTYMTKFIQNQEFIPRRVHSPKMLMVSTSFHNSFDSKLSAFIEEFFPNKMVILNHPFETKWLYQRILLNNILISEELFYTK